MEIADFQREWEGKLRAHIEQAKRQEESLQQQHDEALQEFSDRMVTEENQRVRFSSKVLAMRKNLENLIRVREYCEAEVIREMLMQQ